METVTLFFFHFSVETTTTTTTTSTTTTTTICRFCESRFKGKCIRLLENSYLFAFGQYNPVDLTKSQIKECLRLRGLKGSLFVLDTLKELQRKYRESTSPFNHLKPMRYCKYKCSLVHAILDSRRDRITTNEIGYFRWKLFYQNRPSSTGIRHFREDGVYVSPYLGRATWELTEKNEFIIHKFTRPLSVRRRREDWGWTIGKGSRSEYWSVLPPAPASTTTSTTDSTTAPSTSRNIIQRFLTC